MQWFINMGFTPVEIVSTLIFCVLLIYPAFRVLERIGINGWFAVLAVIPFVSIIALWVLAFIRWPGEAPAEDEGAEEVLDSDNQVKRSETTSQTK